MTERKAPLSGAKLALLATKARADALDGALAAEPIAITGIGCRLPGRVASPADFWTLVHSGTDAIREVPADRWDASAYFSSDPHAPGKMNSRWGGFLDGADLFDPVFFGVSPREAASMDPQQRLLLEVSWEALWDGGYAPGRLAGSSTGVFVAVSSSDYARLLLDPEAVIGPHSAVGSEQSIAPGRISFLLDLRGPSIALDTACSSSLIAVHLATQSLRTGECRMALAGGVTLKLTPEHYLSLAKLGMLSPVGRCMTFDARANGFVPGEGCAIVVLKRLSDALADGDRIYALIRGSAVNQDGRTSVITAPNGRAQQDVVRAALANARISGRDVTYVETHGTGTVLGDPIEVDALAEVLDAKDAAPCALGALKTNIGHLEVTAGVAGLIKAALALQHEEVPPNLHFESLNPHISLDGTRLFVPTEPTRWKRGAALRFAGVSSFGFSGTNGHVVLEEAPVLPAGRPAGDGRSSSILTVSARTPEALVEFTARYRAFIGDNAGWQHSVSDICAAAAVRRDHYEHRLTVVGSTHDEIAGRLADVATGRAGAGTSLGRAPLQPMPLAFVFSGQGSQWPTMGAALMAEEPVFRAAIDECDRLVRDLAGWSLIDVLAADEAKSTLNRTEHAQPAICAIEIALARLLSSWGVEPAIVIGHSAGEIAAAHVAGFIGLEEAMRLIVHRGRIMQDAGAGGRMAAVSLPATEVMVTLGADGNRVSIAAMNGPQSTVVSGPREAVEALTSAWHARGVDVRPMSVEYAFHSSQMDPLLPQLKRAFGNVSTTEGAVPLVSTVTGLEVSRDDLDASHWVLGVRQPVLFRHAIDAVLARGAHAFVEIGPHPVLARDIAQCASRIAEVIPVLPTLRRGQPERGAMLTAVGGLFTAGHPIAWEKVCGGRGPVISLPPYPYQRERYWLEATRIPVTRDVLRGSHTGALIQVDSPAVRGRAWETTLGLQTAPFLADHRIGGVVVFPLTGFIDLASAAIDSAIPRPVTLENILLIKPLVFTDHAPIRVQIVIEGDHLTIYSRGSAEWHQHVSATVRVEERRPSEPSNLPEGPWSQRDPTAFYEQLNQRGLAYGPLFRGIQTLRTSGAHVIADVALPEGAEQTSSRTFHPALLDACFQAVLASDADDRAAYMPIALDAITVYEPACAQVRCIVIVRPAVNGNIETRSADIVITTPEGKTVAEARGFHLKRVTDTGGDVDGRTFEVRWVRDERNTDHEIQVAQPPMSPGAPSILMVSDSTRAAAEISNLLASHGVTCEVRASDRLDDVILATHDRVIVVAPEPVGSLDDPLEIQEDGCRVLLDVVQRMVRQTADATRELWVVTRDAHRVVGDDECSGFAHASMWGLVRTAALEHPMMRWVRADVDASPASLFALVNDIRQGVRSDEIAFRAGRRYVPRLLPMANDRTPKRLVIVDRGSIENLDKQPTVPRVLGSHDVEIAVEASALNFRDVMNVLGAYPGDPGALGVECCGRVTAVGNAVQRFAVGDRVMGIGWGSLSDVVVTDAALVTPVPKDLTSEAAATLPNVFATAYHCLVEVARVGPGERVLIHAAAGGVGLMAVQIAKHLGAEIIATAGSDEKRRVLLDAGVAHVFDSRSLSFADDVSRITGGRGVDVALNSLAGDFIGATLGIVRRGGRFVEIGKTAVWSEAEVAALGRDIDYTVVDLGTFVDREPWRIAAHFEQLQEWLRMSVIHPLPHRVFRFEDAKGAFRYMERGRHVGKVVLQHSAGRRIAVAGTWMLTGGLGALGLQTADWLASCGVERMVLIGRQAPSSGALERVEALRRKGVRVDVHSVDVAQTDAYDTLDRILADAGPHIAGIMHLAGVVDDGVLEQQDWPRFRMVFGAKVGGSWLLHRLASKHHVSQLVLFSSISAVLGSPGQSAYGAANAFLDGLAAYRAARGDQTVAINWGAWAEGGMAARLDADGKRRGLDVVLPMSSEACLATLTGIFESGIHHAAVFSYSPTADATPAAIRLRSLLAMPDRLTRSTTGDAPSLRLGDVLAGLPRTRARKMFIDHLRDETRLVLGLPSSHFVDEQQPLMKMGLDSLMALEMRNRIAAAFGRPLSATLLFDHPTIGALADFLIPAQVRDQDGIDDDQDLVDVAALSDEEAERLLEKELDARLGAE